MRHPDFGSAAREIFFGVLSEVGQLGFRRQGFGWLTYPRG
jgi:hypothetical protein